MCDIFFRLNEFGDKCNQESVALEKLEELEDVQFMKDLLKEFVEKTGSTLAQFILDNWATERDFFVKVTIIFQKKKTSKLYVLYVMGWDL